MTTKKRNEKPILIMSILVSIYWVLGNLIDVYSSKVLGAIFEFFWFPMLILFVVLPLAAIFYLIQNKTHQKVILWVSIILLLTTFLYINLKHSL